MDPLNQPPPGEFPQGNEIKAKKSPEIYLKKLKEEGAKAVEKVKQLAQRVHPKLNEPLQGKSREHIARFLAPQPHNPGADNVTPNNPVELHLGEVLPSQRQLGQQRQGTSVPKEKPGEESDIEILGSEEESDIEILGSEEESDIEILGSEEEDIQILGSEEEPKKTKGTEEEPDIQILGDKEESDIEYLEDDIQINDSSPSQVTTPPATPSRTDPTTRLKLTGIPQYGNSCYMASTMQAFMTCSSFEGMARKEYADLAHKINATSDPQEKQVLINKREALRLLTNFIEIYKSGNASQASNALKTFHKFCSENIQYGGGNKLADPNNRRMGAGTELTGTLKELIPNVMNLGQNNFSRLKGIVAGAMHMDAPSAFRDELPHAKILYVAGMDWSQSWNEIETVDLSQQIPPNTKFRLVGITFGPPGFHDMAYVRRGSKWFHCNDGVLTEIEKPEFSTPNKKEKLFIYERVE